MCTEGSPSCDGTACKVKPEGFTEEYKFSMPNRVLRHIIEGHATWEDALLSMRVHSMHSNCHAAWINSCACCGGVPQLLTQAPLILLFVYLQLPYVPSLNNACGVTQIKIERNPDCYDMHFMSFMRYGDKPAITRGVAEAHEKQLRDSEEMFEHPELV